MASDNSEEEKKATEAPAKRFSISTKEEENKRVFPGEKVAYANRLLEEHIPDGDIEKNYCRNTSTCQLG